MAPPLKPPRWWLAFVIPEHRQGSRQCGRTKVHQFDPSLRGQQDVVALDVAVDGLVDVQVLEALRGQRFKPPLAT